MKLGQGSLSRDALLVLGVAVAVRMITSLSQALYGVHGVPDFGLSTWNDFYGGYVQWLEYLQKGLLPYRDFYTYKYTPLFLYTLYPFFAAGGAHIASIPIVASDAATALLVFLLVNKSASNRVAIAAGLLYALSPFVLYYEGYLWLSSQPMTLFLLLALYLLNEDRPVASFAALALSVMFKQEALFIFPGYLLLCARGHRPSLPKGLVLFFAVLVVVSLPFLLVAPTDYLSSLNYLPVSLNLGKAEPSLPMAFAIVGSASQQANALSSCGMTMIPRLYTGTVCGSIVNPSEFAASLLVGRLDQVVAFLDPLLLVLALPLLYVSRRRESFPEVLCAYSLLALLAVFAQYAEPSLGYYFVPVYALLFASVTDGKTLALGIVTATISAFLPEGPFQTLLPLAFLFVLVVLQDLPATPAHASRPKPRLPLGPMRLSRGQRKIHSRMSNARLHAETPGRSLAVVPTSLRRNEAPSVGDESAS